MKDDIQKYKKKQDLTKKVIVYMISALIIVATIILGVVLFMNNNDGVPIIPSTDQVEKPLASQILDPCQDLIDHVYPAVPFEINSETDLHLIQMSLHNDLVSAGSDISLSLNESCLVTIIASELNNRDATNAPVPFDAEYFNETADRYIKYYDMASPTLTEALTVLTHGLASTTQYAVRASLLTDIISILTKVRECVQINGYITEPADAQMICRDHSEMGVWPQINDKGAQWSGCDFRVVRTAQGQVQDVTFCVTLPDRTVSTCTLNGCENMINY